jgi:hypothetical protein
MEKRKRKVCFFITIVGVVIIILVQTIILIDDEAKEKESIYIKTNILNAYNKCLKDGKCEGDTTLDKLIDEGYISGYFLTELDSYSKKSLVVSSTNEVKLIKNK